MDVGVFLREVNPIGGEEKAKACLHISEKFLIPLSEGFYSGDSITDSQALLLFKKSNGVALSFNGNRYALRNAEFYALSKRGDVFLELAKKFVENGKQAIEEYKPSDFEFGRIPEDIAEFEELVKKSEDFRKRVRGEIIGGLG